GRRTQWILQARMLDSAATRRPSAALSVWPFGGCYDRGAPAGGWMASTARLGFYSVPCQDSRLFASDAVAMGQRTAQRASAIEGEHTESKAQSRCNHANNGTSGRACAFRLLQLWSS